MSGKKLLVLGLALIFVVGSLMMVACGGDDTAAKEAMQTALTKVEADMAGLAANPAALTGASIKAALAQYGPDWTALVDACKNLKGADATKAQSVWDALSTAVAALPDDANLVQLAPLMAAGGPVEGVQTFMADLRKLVPAEATATTVAP